MGHGQDTFPGAAGKGVRVGDQGMGKEVFRWPHVRKLCRIRVLVAPVYVRAVFDTANLGRGRTVEIAPFVRDTPTDRTSKPSRELCGNPWEERGGPIIVNGVTDVLSTTCP
jgi:hypothetical protein